MNYIVVIILLLCSSGCASKYWVEDNVTYLNRGMLNGKVEIEIDSEGKTRKMTVEDKLKIPDLSFFPISLGTK